MCNSLKKLLLSLYNFYKKNVNFKKHFKKHFIAYKKTYSLLTQISLLIIY